MRQDLRAPARPKPEQFDDYRDYLKSIVAFLRRNAKGFSSRNFARRAGYNSSGFLYDILQGRRGLSPGAIGKFAGGLGLDRNEAEAFESLVLFNQATTDAERTRHYERLRKRRRAADPQGQFTSDQYEVLTTWYTFPIREMMLLPDFREDPKWIARRLQPKIKAAEAERGLKLLERVGLAIRDKNGRLQPADQKISTPPNVEPLPQALAVRSFHRGLLAKAANSLDTIPQNERNVVSLTISITPKQYEQLCKRNMEYLHDLLSDTEESQPGSGQPSEVYVLGLHIFPVTRKRAAS